MKKMNLYMGLLLLLTSFACNDDEPMASIVGVWVGNKAEFDIDPDGAVPAFEIADEDLMVQLDFKSDGVLILTDENSLTTTGTYALSGDRLAISINYEIQYITLTGAYDVEELTQSQLRISLEKQGSYTDSSTGQQFNGTVKATLHFDRQ